MTRQTVAAGKTRLEGGRRAPKFTITENPGFKTIEKEHYKLVIPKGYVPLLDVKKTERAIKDIKGHFTGQLERELNLQRASAPLFLDPTTGLCDDLNGWEKKVSFNPTHIGKTLQMLNSLAKWKRDALEKYGYVNGTGIWTDMNAVRLEEIPDNIHSIYADQFDWEKAIHKVERTVAILEMTVKSIYEAIKATEKMVQEEYGIKPILPENISFVHTEELEAKYPNLMPRERENIIAMQAKAVFIRGIGAKLPFSKQPHDGRAPDYDDWTTVAKDAKGKPGLNGDIFVWHPVLEIGLELSSMGIRVDAESLRAQCTERKTLDRLELPFHKGILDETLPLSIGGGIGQSRLCMALLGKAHIGEVQASVWPDEMRKTLKENGITLL
jgi:aspartate--ammonia ligase